MADGSARAGLRGRAAAHARTPLFRGALLLGIGNAVSGLVGFLFWIVAARQVAADDVGRATAFVAALSLVAGVAQLNLTSAVLRYAGVVGEARRAFVGRAYLVAAVLPTVAAAIVALAAAGSGGTLGEALDGPARQLLFVASVAVWSLFTLQDAALTVLGRTGLVAAENTGYAVAKLALLPALAAIGLTGILLAWVLPSVVLTAVISGLLFHRWLRGGGPAARPLPTLREVVDFVAHNALGAFSVLVTVNGVPLLVAHHAGASHAAYFYMPWTIATSALLLIMAMSSTATVEAAARPAEAGRVLRAALAQSLVVTVPLAVVLLAIGPTLLRLFGASYAASGGSTMRVLALGIVPAALLASSLAIARALDRSRVVGGVQLLVAVLCVGGSALALDDLGIVGAAAAWTTAQVVGCAAFAVIWRRRPA